MTLSRPSPSSPYPCHLPGHPHVHPTLEQVVVQCRLPPAPPPGGSQILLLLTGPYPHELLPTPSSFIALSFTWFDICLKTWVDCSVSAVNDSGITTSRYSTGHAASTLLSAGRPLIPSPSVPSTSNIYPDATFERPPRPPGQKHYTKDYYYYNTTTITTELVRDDEKANSLRDYVMRLALAYLNTGS